MKTQKLFRVGLFSAVLLSGALGSFAQSLTVTNDLQLWLRADAGVTTNASGGVIGWADQTTNGNNAAQLSDSAAPLLVNGALNGRPVIRFDSMPHPSPDYDFLNVPDSESLSFAGDMTTLFVVKIDDFDWFRAIWGKTAGVDQNLPAPTDIYVPQFASFVRAYR